MKQPKIVRRGTSPGVPAFSAATIATMICSRSKWHLLTGRGDRTYCGVAATDEVPDGELGRVCSKCRKEFGITAGIVNLVEDSRARRER